MRYALLGGGFGGGGGVAGLLTGVAARGWFIAPLLGLGGVWASCRYWGPPCLRFIQAACFNMALGSVGFKLLVALLGVWISTFASASWSSWPSSM